MNIPVTFSQQDGSDRFVVPVHIVSAPTAPAYHEEEATTSRITFAEQVRDGLAGDGAALLERAVAPPALPPPAAGTPPPQLLLDNGHSRQSNPPKRVRSLIARRSAGRAWRRCAPSFLVEQCRERTGAAA